MELALLKSTAVHAMTDLDFILFAYYKYNPAIIISS